MTMLTVTYDFKPKETVTLDEVLAWKTWKVWERQRIGDVASGKLSRFSTTHKGVPCDVELATDNKNEQ